MLERAASTAQLLEAPRSPRTPVRGARAVKDGPGPLAEGGAKEAILGGTTREGSAASPGAMMYSS